jgi:hypothetical protein
MIGNIRDHRTEPTNPHIDAVFEPSFHDHARDSIGTPYFNDEPALSSGAYFAVDWQYGTTVRAALRLAEAEWPLRGHRLPKRRLKYSASVIQISGQFQVGRLPDKSHSAPEAFHNRSQLLLRDTL